LILWGFGSLAAQAAPTPAERPDAVLDIEVRSAEGGPAQAVVLVLIDSWRGRVFAPAEALVDPVSTMLRLRTHRQAGCEALAFRGHRLSAHEERGDTVLTFTLLLERCPEGLSGWWHEERMEVPTRLWAVRGSLEGNELRLDLSERVDPGIPGEELSVRGQAWFARKR